MANKYFKNGGNLDDNNDGSNDYNNTEPKQNALGGNADLKREIQELRERIDDKAIINSDKIDDENKTNNITTDNAYMRMLKSRMSNASLVAVLCAAAIILSFFIPILSYKTAVNIGFGKEYDSEMISIYQLEEETGEKCDYIGVIDDMNDFLLVLIIGISTVVVSVLPNSKLTSILLMIFSIIMDFFVFRFCTGFSDELDSINRYIRNALEIKKTFGYYIMIISAVILFICGLAKFDAMLRYEKEKKNF